MAVGTDLANSPKVAALDVECFARGCLKFGRGFIFLVVGAVMWLALLYLPHDVASTELDPSWAQALGHFVTVQFQAGVQYIFPYGPLGYFATPLYDADLFWAKVAWEVLLKLAVVGLILQATRHTLGFISRLLFCVLTAVFLNHNPDGSYVFFLFVVGVSLASAKKLSWPHLALGTFLLATIGLMKFTLLLQAGLMVGLVSGQWMLRRPRWHAAAPPILFSAFLLAWWLALGQALGNIPTYAYNSMQYATGYNDALAAPGNRMDVYLALAILALLAAALASRSLAIGAGTLLKVFSAKVWRHVFNVPNGRPVQQLGTLKTCRHKLPGDTLSIAVVGIFLFLQWKHGFVRQDMHQIFFFSTSLLIPFLFPALFPQFRWRRGPRSIVAGLAVVLGIVGFIHVYVTDQKMAVSGFLPRRVAAFVAQARMLADLPGLRERLNQRRDELARQFALPRIAERVGNATVDAFTYEQGVLLLNQLNWAPRPIFQANLAFSPYLANVNARFLARESAPRFLIFQLLGFDGRLPALEDAQALYQVFQHYHPVLMEGPNLLLERNWSEVGENPSWQPVWDKVVRFGEEVAVGGVKGLYQQAKIKLSYSARGKVRKTLYKPPIVYIHLRTDDNQVHIYRLIPAIAASGFLLNPFLEETGDIVDLYGPGKGKRVVAFTITVDDKGRGSFDDAIHVSLETSPRLVGESIGAEQRKRLRYPMMATPPDSVASTAAVRTETCAGRPVLLVHADGRMIYRVGPEQRRIAGEFGIVPLAYGQGTTEGARFWIEYTPTSGGAATTLWERSLNPREVAGDRGFQSFDVRLPARGEGELVLHTSARPGKRGEWAWSFWTGVRLGGP